MNSNFSVLLAMAATVLVACSAEPPPEAKGATTSHLEGDDDDGSASVDPNDTSSDPADDGSTGAEPTTTSDSDTSSSASQPPADTSTQASADRPGCESEAFVCEYTKTVEINLAACPPNGLRGGNPLGYAQLIVRRVGNRCTDGGLFADWQGNGVACPYPSTEIPRVECGAPMP